MSTSVTTGNAGVLDRTLSLDQFKCTWTEHLQGFPWKVSISSRVHRVYFAQLRCGRIDRLRTMVFGMQARALLVLLLVVEFLYFSFFFQSCEAQDVREEVQTARFVPPFVSLENSLYSKTFIARWNEQNAGAVGDVLQLSLVRNGNTSDGATLSTSAFYVNGYFRASIMLPKGDTAGTVTTFYVASPGGHHSEVDFEFLGNKTDALTGKVEWHLQTNIFANGVGEREQRISLWFDPSQQFHSYSIVWNPKTVSMYVDEVLIRIFQNYEDQGIPYLNSKPVQAYVSVFDGSSWATRGGLDKIDWTNSPFEVLYTRFVLDACVVDPDNVDASPCANPAASYWWNSPYFHSLPAKRLAFMDAINRRYMRYNYCTDYKRYPIPPKECILPRR